MHLRHIAASRFPLPAPCLPPLRFPLLASRFLLSAFRFLLSVALSPVYFLFDMHAWCAESVGVATHLTGEFPLGSLPPFFQKRVA